MKPSTFLLLCALALPAGLNAPVAHAAPATAGLTNAQYLADFQQTATDLRASYKSFNAAWGGNLFPNLCVAWNENQANEAQKAKINELRKQLDALMASAPRASDAIRKYADLVMSTEVEGFHVGNCGEMSSVTFAIFTQRYPELKFMVVGVAGGDHYFVLARNAAGEVFVIDAWQGEAGGPYRYSANQLVDPSTGKPPSTWPDRLKEITGWE